MFEFRWQGMLQEDMKNKQIRIHPTEKPYQLYSFCLEKYAKIGDKILDTHSGSNSLAISVMKANLIGGMNLKLTSCEIDEKYFSDSVKRINKFVKEYATAEQEPITEKRQYKLI